MRYFQTEFTSCPFVDIMMSRSLGTRLPYPKGEGESGTVAYREPLWATAWVRIPKCQLIGVGEALKEVLDE